MVGDEKRALWTEPAAFAEQRKIELSNLRYWIY
jgi:hypothetical protein